MSMFNQFFQNPYAQYLPPEAQEALRRQQIGNLGTALMQNSYTNKSGVAAFGDALAQFRQGQSAEAQQMMGMQQLAERMRLAQAENQRRQGVFEGKDFASKEGVRQFDQRDATTRRGQDKGLAAAQARSSMFGFNMGGPGDPGQPPMSPAEAAKAAFENARRAPDTGDAGAATAPPEVASTTPGEAPRKLRPNVKLTSGNQKLIKDYATALKNAGKRGGFGGGASFDRLDDQIRRTLPQEVVQWIEQNVDTAIADPSSALYQ